MTNDDPTLSRNVLEFVAIADEFCRMIEDAEKLDKSKLLKSLGGFAPLLYLRGTLLPKIVPEYPEANERFVTLEQWENIFNLLKETLGHADRYWFADKNDTDDPELMQGSLAEGIADTYQDLKDFTLLFKRNQLAACENAIAACSQLFIERWGLSLSLIIQALHQLNYAATLPEQDLY